MKLVDLSIKEFIETLASSAPAPGGGSVSALAGANGCALMAMAGDLSFKKKAYKALDESIKIKFGECIDIFKENYKNMLLYIDEDTKAFNQLMDAFRMPKISVDDKARRQIAIQKATMETIRVPMEVCQLGIESLRLVEFVMPYANKNTISDQGVGVMMLQNAIEGSAMNVLINLPGLDQLDLVKAYKKEVRLIQEESRQLKEDLLSQIKL